MVYEKFVKEFTAITIILSAAAVIAYGPVPAEAAAQKYYRVAYDNCGVDGKQPHMVQGTNWTWSQNALAWDEVSADSPVRRVSYWDNGPVVYKYNGLDPEAGYKLRIVYLSSETPAPRLQKVLANESVLEKRL